MSAIILLLLCNMLIFLLTAVLVKEIRHRRALQVFLAKLLTQGRNRHEESKSDAVVVAHDDEPGVR